MKGTEKIGIVGATGMIGQPVTTAFIKAGFSVTILVRDIRKAKRIFGNTVKYVSGDLQNISSLAKFVTGLDCLYLNLSVAQNSKKNGFQPEREWLDNIIAITKNTSIKRIGYLSSLVHLYQGNKGFYWWVFEIKRMAVNKIKLSGISYSIFYPSTFMENFDKGEYRRGSLIALAGASKFKMFLIAASDYGGQVVKAFELNNGCHEFVIQGAEGFTAAEAARFYREHYNKSKIIIVNAPLWILQFAGKFNRKFNYGAKIIEALNNYPEKFEAQNTWDILGKPKTNFIEYINAG